MRAVRWFALILSVSFVSVLNASSTSTPAPAIDSMAGSISGRVTSSTNGLGLASTVIQVYDIDNDFLAGQTTADGAGNYSLNLAAGTYAVLTQNIAGHINEIWNNVQCSAVCDVESITPIVLTNSAVTGIDFVLDPGGRVSGTITSTATGLPLAGVEVWLIDSGPSVRFTKGVTDVNGVFVTEGGTAAGNVYAVTGNKLGYQNELYNNVKCENCDPSEPATLGTLIPVAGTGITGGVTFALDLGAAASGTVTDENGAPLANVIVEFTNASFTLSFGAETDADGHYTTGGMSAGTYYAKTFNAQDRVDYLYSGVLCPNGNCNPPAQGTPIVLTIGNITQNVDFALPVGGRIAGAVTNAVGGAPIPLNTGNAGVSIFNALGQFVMSVQTENDGTYITPPLPPGIYYAETQNVPGFGNNLYNGIGCSGCQVQTGTQIPVTAFNTSANVNFSLTATGSISGTVTNAAGGAAISNVPVQVFSITGSLIGSVNTNASGVYTFGGLAADSYYVRTNQSGAFMNEIYNDIFCNQCGVTQSGAQLVPVTAGNTTNNINFALATGGRISGTVTNVSGGAGIQNVSVQIFNLQNVQLGNANTNASGAYTTTGLPAGTYYLRTSNSLGFVNKLWNDIACPYSVCVASDGTPIAVTIGNTTPNINFALTTGATISGTVTNAGGAPLQNVSVQAFNVQGKLLGSVNSNAAGSYTTAALPNGTYYIRTANSLGFMDEVWNDEECVVSCLPTSGNPIDIAGGVNSTGKNFALSLAGSISGTVKDAGTLQPMSGVTVGVYSAGGQLVRASNTNATGSYIVAGLASGVYHVRTSNIFSYYDEIFGLNSLCEFSCLPTDGSGVPVTAGEVTNSIDFELTSGAEIVQNSHFNTFDASNYPTVWSIFAQPTNPTDLVGKMVNGAFEYYRTPSSTSGVLVQHTGADFAQGQGMLAQFFLSNTSDVRKRVSVLITEGDFSDITVCTFWLPPNLGVRRFGMLTHTTKPWTDATISFYAASAGSNGGAYRIDDVTLLPTPWSVEDTLCVDPFKPPIGFAPDGPNMIINGDFSAPWTPGQPPQNWNTPNQIVWQVAGGVFEFLRPVPNADPAGVVLQQTGQPLSQGDILTADFQLGNSSGVRKRVTVLLQDADFSDLSACTFWLAPGQPLSPYRMRSYASKPWANATISIFAATAGNEQWMRLDNVTMKKTPSAHINGADCDEPPVGPEPPTEGAAAASVTGAARSSVTASAESAASGVELGANGSGASTVAIRSIDLRQASGSLLRFQSRRGADVSRAEIQISLDGETWQTLADVPPSDDWLNIDIDLSGFAGQVVQLRFVIDGEVTEDRSAFNRWVMRHFEIWW